MTTSTIRSCYISAPIGSNLDALHSALQERGIKIAVPDGNISSSTWLAEISKLLSQVDLVIGVLTHKRSSDWTLFELGLAFAVGRPALLLAPIKGTVSIPFDLKGVLTIRTTLSNREAIDFALDQLLAAPRRGASDELKPAPSNGLGSRVDSWIRDTNSAVAAGQGDELERIVEGALREAGTDALASRAASDRGVDIAVWSDALQLTMGNPLLIEIKMRTRTKQELRIAAAQLSKHVSLSGNRWGLLLYGDGPPSGTAQLAMPANVLASSLGELYEGMRHGSFAAVINDLRNRRAHGVQD